MKIGIPVWNERISPVFDTAGRLLVVDIAGGREIGRGEHLLADPAAPLRVRRLKEIGVELLICGAISNPIACMIDAAGIELFPWVSGNVDDVLEAFRHERLADSRYRMPGCRRAGRGFRRGMWGARGQGGGRGYGRGGWQTMKGADNEDSGNSDR